MRNLYNRILIAILMISTTLAIIVFLANGTLFTAISSAHSHADTELTISAEQVTVRKNLGEVLLVPNAESNIGADFTLSKDVHKIFGKFKLSESTCTCVGRLPEHIEIPKAGTIAIRFSPRISFQNEVTSYLWRAKYLPFNDRLLPAVELQLHSQLIPRIQYKISSPHSNSVVPVNVRSPRFELEIISARYKDEPRAEEEIQLSLARSQMPTQITLLESGFINSGEMLNTVFRKSRFALSPDVTNSAWNSMQTDITLLAKVGTSSELMIPIVLAPESDLSVSPTKLFLAQTSFNELKGTIIVRSKTPISIEKMECSLKDARLVVDNLDKLPLHIIYIYIPIDKLFNNQSDLPGSVLNETVSVWTTHPDYHKIDIHAYAILPLLRK